MNVQRLNETFTALCRKLEFVTDALYTSFEDEKNTSVFSMYFRSIKLQLVYSWRWEDVAPPSVLYCRVFLNKNNPLYLHLPELLGCLGVDDYRACYFPYIESPERMAACFQALMDIVNEYIPVLEKLAENGRDQEIMDDWRRRDFFDPAQISEKLPADADADTRRMAENMYLYARKLQESTMVARHTSLNAYESYLKGDWEKSLKQYRKLEKNGLSEYEQGLCRFISLPENRDFVPMPPECMTLSAYKKASGQRTEWKCVGLLYVPSSVVLCGLLAVMNGIYAKGTRYFFGIPWWFGLILALLPAIFGMFVFQRQLLAVLDRHDGGARSAYFGITKAHPRLKRIIAAFWGIVAAGCLVFCIALPGMSTRFYDTYGIHDTETGASRRFEYNEVAAIYYISARYNDYGDRIGRPSCVLVLNDGTKLDLDSTGASAQKQLEVVSDLFPGMECIRVDSDRDLP